MGHYVECEKCGKTYYCACWDMACFSDPSQRTPCPYCNPELFPRYCEFECRDGRIKRARLSASGKWIDIDLPLEKLNDLEAERARREDLEHGE